MKAELREAPEWTNRLGGESSPYLLQHAHNPVDWYPWGEEALAAAEAENKPIFLSIGYSACHWCHVMERESFESEAIAAVLNEHFISIKVDREERPDLDEIYMGAVQAMTGRGGWPMSVFLTPERTPFFGGSYYPPEDRFGLPGFKTVLLQISDAWENNPGQLREVGRQITEHLRNQWEHSEDDERLPDAAVIDAAVKELRFSFDSTHGGFGPAPKFPPSGAVRLLLRRSAATGGEQVKRMAVFTLRKMMEGGLFDQLGGGVHRYSVDAQWLVPHFEKMLYDNALLVPAYLEAHALTGDAAFKQAAVGTLEYVLRDLHAPEGGFFASEDADSEGEEGKFYVWAYDEVMDLLGAEDGALFCQYYGVRPEGSFSSHEAYHKGMNILHVARPVAEVAEDFHITVEELSERLSGARWVLSAERHTRVRPGRDEKIITAWNALMISALAQASTALSEPRYEVAAERAGRFVQEQMLDGDVLRRVFREGRAHTEGCLEDYTFTANAFVDLYEATGLDAWLQGARDIMELCETHFWDPNGGGFFRADKGLNDLIVRTKPLMDGAEPSGNAMAALALGRLAELTGENGYREKAERVLQLSGPSMMRMPQGFFYMMHALECLEA